MKKQEKSREHLRQSGQGPAPRSEARKSKVIEVKPYTRRKPVVGKHAHAGHAHDGRTKASHDVRRHGAPVLKVKPPIGHDLGSILNTFGR